MTFIALPGQLVLLAAAAAAALVLLFYWLKPPPRRLIVPSTLIWKQVLQKRKGRRWNDRLRWWLSLLAALAIALALGLSIGRPVLEGSGGGPREIALILDTSPTMQTRTRQGATRWERALGEARRLIIEAPEGSRFRIADTGGRLDPASAVDREQALTQLEGLKPEFSSRRRLPTQGFAQGADVFFISDGVLLPPGQAPGETVSVYEPADNLGIVAFSTRRQPGDPRSVSAYLEIVNASLSDKSAEVVISGAGELRITRSIQLRAGESWKETLDVSDFDRGPLRATVTSAGDAFAADDRAFSYRPAAKRLRTALFTEGNRWLETLLGLDPGVLLQVLPPSAYRRGMAADVLIFDRTAPDQVPAAPSILFAPSEAAWLPPRLGESSAPAPDVWRADHPLLEGVPRGDFTASRLARLEEEGWEVLASSGGTPLLLTRQGGIRQVLVPFDLGDSSLPLSTGFAAFLGNALQWTAGDSLAISSNLGLISLEVAAENVTDLQGKRVEKSRLLGRTLFQASQPGLFSLSGQGRREHVAANLSSRRTSLVNRSDLPSWKPATAEASGSRGWGLKSLLLWAAALLLGLEWWTYNRRLTI